MIGERVGVRTQDLQIKRNCGAEISPAISTAVVSNIPADIAVSPVGDDADLETTFGNGERAFRWRQDGKFGPPSRRILDLFTRYDFGWGHRGSIEGHHGLKAVLDAGMVGFRLHRISKRIAKKAASFRLPDRTKESAAHRYLKRSALIWMQGQGASDAKEECICAVGRADVYSRESRWAVECGNTDIRKLADAINAEAPFRLPTAEETR